MPAQLALGATPAPSESYGTLLRQIDSRQVLSAHVNQLTHDIRVKLTDGTEQLVVFPSSRHRQLIDSLLHHGIKPIYTKHRPVHTAVHHVLRYILIGVLALLVLVGGSAWIYRRDPNRGPQSTDVQANEP